MHAITRWSPRLVFLRDIQSLAYLIVQPMLAIWMWRCGFSVCAFALMLFLSVGISNIHHNHCHLPMWRERWANRATSTWIALLAAHPSFVFRVAHEANHHRYKHGERDVARTYRFGGDHNHLRGWFMHPFQAMTVLGPLLVGWLGRIRRRSPSSFRYCILQLGLIGVSWLVLVVIDPVKTLLYVWLPQAYGLHWLLASNYMQHAHADGHSPLNYARNFEGCINQLLLNIGLHTAHHEHPKAHWSELPALHERYRLRVHPELIERSFFWYILRVYWGGLVWRSCQSRPLMHYNAEVRPGHERA